MFSFLKGKSFYFDDFPVIQLLVSKMKHNFEMPKNVNHHIIV